VFSHELNSEARKGNYL